MESYISYTVSAPSGGRNTAQFDGLFHFIYFDIKNEYINYYISQKIKLSMITNKYQMILSLYLLLQLMLYNMHFIHHLFMYSFNKIQCKTNVLFIMYSIIM